MQTLPRTEIIVILDRSGSMAAIRRGTALYDAIGHALAWTKLRHAALRAAPPPRVLCVIITDGGENSLCTYDRAAVLAKIARRRADHGWEFVFLGANQDAFAVGRSLGIAHAYGFTATAEGARALMRDVSRGSAGYRAGQGYAAPPRPPAGSGTPQGGGNPNDD